MSTKPAFVLHHQYAAHIAEHDEHPQKALPPVIPDLRFEPSYLRSIQRYVTIRLRQLSTISELEGKDGHHSNPTSSNPSSEIIDINWGRVAWITTRDQVISPFVQGALWALASYFLTPFSAQLGSRVGSFTRSKLSSSKEGSGIGWLRGLVGGAGLSTSLATTRRS